MPAQAGSPGLRLQPAARREHPADRRRRRGSRGRWRGTTPLLDGEDDWGSSGLSDESDDELLEYRSDEELGGGARRARRRSPSGRSRRLLWSYDPSIDRRAWPPSGIAPPAGSAGCCACPLVWDPRGAFEPAHVETTLLSLVCQADQFPTRVGAAGFPPAGDERLLTLRQGRLLLQRMVEVAHLKREGSVAMRRASLCDNAGLVASFGTPFFIVLYMYVVGAEDAAGGPAVCDGGGASLVLALLLGLLALASRVTERLCNPRAEGRSKLATAAALHSELQRFVAGAGDYRRNRRVMFAVLLERLARRREAATSVEMTGSFALAAAQTAAAATPLHFSDVSDAAARTVAKVTTAVDESLVQGGIK